MTVTITDAEARQAASQARMTDQRVEWQMFKRRLFLRFGGPEGIRTPDLYSAIVALSQLSYRPGSADSRRRLGMCQDEKRRRAGQTHQIF